MLCEINRLVSSNGMTRYILYAFLILLLVPVSLAFSQEYSDNAPTLSVSLGNEPPFVYQDSDGYTVVVGIIENNDSMASVGNVQVIVNFFDDTGNSPLEVVSGYSTLEVIPPNGKSTYSIRSESANPKITDASIALVGFNSSIDKQKGLSVYSTDIFLDTALSFSGVLENGGAPSSSTNVYIAFYDGFEPPRILNVDTIDIGIVYPNTNVPFVYDEEINPRAVGFLLFAESNVFGSDFVDIQLPASQIPDKIVTITGVSIEDVAGNKLSELDAGEIYYVKSRTVIEFGSDMRSDETPYTYYVQIKKSPERRGDPPTVEYIGKFDGRFIGSGVETQTIDWIPLQPGFFFVETFVWDRDNVPIAEQGPYTLMVVR